VPQKTIEEIQKDHEEYNRIMRKPFEKFSCDKCDASIERDQENGELKGKILVVYNEKTIPKGTFINTITRQFESIREVKLIHSNLSDCRLKYDLEESYPPGLRKAYPLQKNVNKFEIYKVIKTIKMIRGRVGNTLEDNITDMICRLNIPYYEEANQYIGSYLIRYRGEQFNPINKTHLKELHYYLHWIYAHGFNKKW